MSDGLNLEQTRAKGTLMGMQNFAATLEDSLAVSNETINIVLQYDPVIMFLSILFNPVAEHNII